MYIGKTRSPVAVILLTLITCGIYGLYWYYTVMEDLNRGMGREYISSGLMVLLTIICAPVGWYILYKVDKGLSEFCNNENIPYQENFILWLLLTFVLGVGAIVAMVQITGVYNKLWEKRSGGNLVV